MKLLLSTGIGYKTHRLRDLERLALEAGYDGLELNLPPRHLAADETNRDTAYDSVSTIRAIHAPGDVYDGPRFASALRDTLALADQLSVPLINIHPAVLSVGGRDNVLRGIELIKEYEKKSDISIVYEMLVDPAGLEADRQAYFIEQQAYVSMDDYLADVQQYDLAATLDTAHLGTWHIPPHKYIAQLGQHLKHVHLSDYSSKLKREHLLLGDGELDLKTFLQTLHVQAPDITVTVELHPPATADKVVEVIQKSITYIRDALLDKK